MGWHKTNFNHSAFCTCHEFFSPGYRKDITENKKKKLSNVKYKLYFISFLVRKKGRLSQNPLMQREVKDMFKVTCSVARVRGYNLS